jgi:hypothetical protein
MDPVSTYVILDMLRILMLVVLLLEEGYRGQGLVVAQEEGVTWLYLCKPDNCCVYWLLVPEPQEERLDRWPQLLFGDITSVLETKDDLAGFFI